MSIPDAPQIYYYCKDHFVAGWSEYTFPASFIYGITPCVVCGGPSVHCSTEKVSNPKEYANSGKYNFSAFFVVAIPQGSAYGMATFYGTDRLHSVIDFLSNLRSPFVVDTMSDGGYAVYTVSIHLNALRELVKTSS